MTPPLQYHPTPSISPHPFIITPSLQYHPIPSISPHPFNITPQKPVTTTTPLPLNTTTPLLVFATYCYYSPGTAHRPTCPGCSSQSSLSEATTLQLEFNELTRLTKDIKYHVSSMNSPDSPRTSNTM